MLDDGAAMRTERDALGEVMVPAAAYWGAQTQRSLTNFDFPPAERMPMGVVMALARIKRAAARLHRDGGRLDPVIADAIIAAADAVLAGRHDDQFPLTIWQTGSGTQSNMNVNDVLAGIANEALAGTRGGKTPVHPNDHVNKGQSSNDSFPTAMHIAAALDWRDTLEPALSRLIDALAAKAAAFAATVKIGRTHLQDATPLTLGQEFSAFVTQLAACRTRLETAVHGDIHALAQGGTAVGTGLGAPAGFGDAMAAALGEDCALPLKAADNPFEALASNDGLVFLSGALATLAGALSKIASDIRLLGSGPRSGLGELILPENEPGSSIMPGKVNPTQVEMLTMVAAQVIGNHQAVITGGMQGQLQLNVMKPMIIANVLRSMDLLARGMDGFARHCVAGLRPDRARIAELVDRSLMLVTALVPAVGYDTAAAIARDAHARGTTLRDAALASGSIDADTYDRLVDPVAMTGTRRPEPSPG